MSYQFDDGYPSDLEAKRDILEVGRRMYAKNFVASNDGNISCKVSDRTLWCTPTGVSKGYMTDEMLVLMDLDGNVLRGSWKPSSEMKMHLRVYNENPAVRAVVHAHPLQPANRYTNHLAHNYHLNQRPTNLWLQSYHR